MSVRGTLVLQQPDQVLVLDWRQPGLWSSAIQSRVRLTMWLG